jgi:hypothetical protein
MTIEQIIILVLVSVAAISSLSCSVYFFMHKNKSKGIAMLATMLAFAIAGYILFAIYGFHSHYVF